MKVVINSCFGGFSISIEAARAMAAMGCIRAKQEVADYNKELAAFAHYKEHMELPTGNDEFRTSMFDIYIKYGGLPPFHGYGYMEGMDGGYQRDDPYLVRAVEELGEKANGAHARLVVVEIPDGVNWEINEYDGNEHVAEKHRTWA